MYIHRQLESEILPFLARKEAIAIIGPRQSGKTTFLEFIQKKFKKDHKKVKFFTFEKRADLALFQNSIEDFKDIASAYDCVIIDEFQYAKEAGQKLKYLYDTTDVKFIISGSSSLDLTFQTGKYMVGRMLNFELMPFCFREFLSFADKDLFNLLEKRVNSKNLLEFNIKSALGSEINSRLAQHLETFAIYGGYPAVSLSKNNNEKKKVLQGIAEQYLLKEIKALLNLATEDELMRLSKLLAAQTGNMITYQELANSSGLTNPDVRKHLNILEKTFIIRLIKPFFINKRTELIKNPKVYFLDSGFRNFLISDFREFSSRNDSGALMENCAFRALNGFAMSSDVNYWRTKSKAEVDFIVEYEQQKYPVEIKYVSRKIIGKSLYSFIDKFHPSRGFVLTRDYIGKEKVRNTIVNFIPLSYFS